MKKPMTAPPSHRRYPRPSGAPVEPARVTRPGTAPAPAQAQAWSRPVPEPRSFPRG